MTRASPSLPVTPAELAQSLEALAAPERIIIAVSGGPDSMALARLCAAQSNARDYLAVTVDHGLREEAAREAEAAGAWCRAAGLAHRTLRWRGEKPGAGVQAAARAARYSLLAELAEAEGFGAILTAHTADDQAETVFMRLARGSGPTGLAGMEAATKIAAGAGAPVRLLRPLLDAPRRRLAATLAVMGQDAVSDPSNDDPAYERVRTRALLAALQEQSLLTGDALRRTARRAREAAARIAAADVAAFEACSGAFEETGAASLVDRGAPPSLIAQLVRAVGGGDHAPPDEDAAAALETVRKGGAATLGGVMLKSKARRFWVFREPAALLGRAGVAPAPPVVVAAQGRVLWDSRFIVSNRAAIPLEIAPSPLASDMAPDAGAAPAEAVAGWPAALHPATAHEIIVESLAEERFFESVLRFPAQ